MARIDRKLQRRKRHVRIRKKLHGTPERPRLCVFKSLKHIYAQLIDDENLKTITGVSTLTPSLRPQVQGLKGVEKAKVVGKAIAERARELSIESVVFDRAGYKYTGRIKALAEAAREAGLKF